MKTHNLYNSYMYSITFFFQYSFQQNYVDIKGFHVACILLAVIIQSRGWQTFSMKDQSEKILDFMGHMVFVETIQFGHCTRKAAIDDM